MILLDVILYKNVFNKTSISMLNSIIDFNDHFRDAFLPKKKTTQKTGFLNDFKNC